MANGKKKHIAAIILAAGKGSRIGQPKWQLRYEGRTFLEVILAKLQECQCAAVMCVTAAEMAEDISLLIEKNRSKENFSATPIILAINPNPVDGMLSSVYYGLQSLPNYDGYLIFPVDHPFVETKTVQLLIDIFSGNGKCFDSASRTVIIPSYNEAGGHPIIVSSHIFTDLSPVLLHLRFKDFLLQFNYQRHKIAVEDSGILRNVNNLQDLK